MNKIKCTLDDLYKFSQKYDFSDKIKVKSRFGFYNIKNIDITAKNSDTFKIITDKNKTLTSSPDHLLFIHKKGWTKVRNIKIGDELETIDGLEKVKFNENQLKKLNLYDIEVDSVKEYFANGIVSHNSSISDVVKFGLYGKIGSKRTADIPNRFNQSTFVRIELQQNETNIKIERGITPTFVNLFINDVEYDQAGKKNIDMYIEEEILGLPFYVFNNIVSLSINDFKSFLKMSPNDKRLIVDKIFDLGLINTIRNLIKEELRQIKDNIYLLGKEHEILDKQIKNSADELEKLKIELNEDNDEKRGELIDKINNFSEQHKEIVNQISILKDKEQKAKEKIEEFNEVFLHNSHQLKIIDEKKKLYENNKCPICESDLTTSFHQNLFKEYLEKEEKIKKSLEALTDSLQKLRNLKSNINNSAGNLERQRTQFNFFIQESKSKLNELQKNINTPKEISYIEKHITETKKTKENLNKNVDKQDNKKNFYKIIDEIFGDKGIKQIAIQKILPTLNAEIKRVLKELSLNYRVIFNSEFEPSILHLGYSVSSQQLSTGERKKIDFAVLVAMIRLLKIKYHGLNIIFLDEIFSSIDSNGIHHILEILSKVTRELNINIFVINHTVLPSEIFDYKIEVTKNNNFSNIEIEKIE